LADDAIDLDERAGDFDGSAGALEGLRDRLERAYAGRPLPIAADRALADVVARFGVPRALPLALLEGFEWDAAGRRYEDIDALYAYAARVAGAVGAMMATLMGARSRDVVARACELGVAMQLTNIARDVGEDARAGRLYLPLQWLDEAGVDPDAWLARPVFSPALGSVVARLLVTADALYERAAAGVPALPLACRPGIHAARLLYAEIGREVQKLGFDSVSRRAVVPPGCKARLLAHALAAAAGRWRAETAPPLEATRFLVEAVAAARVPHVAAVPPVAAWRSVEDRVAWLLDLFERLERREQVQRSSAGL
jgi:phytoene synthase